VSTRRWTRTAAVAATACMALSVAACGGNETTDTAGGGTPSATVASETASPSMSPTGGAMGAMPFGAGCSAVPASGAGSFQGMSTAPVATAASANPVLSTLVTAVKAAGLVDTLNGLPSATVFAPSNAAFEKVPPAQLKALLADKAMLTKVLTYHVIPGQKVTPDMLASAPLTSVQKGAVKVTGSGEDFTVNGMAKVVCGNVQTANATVYIIDSVLMPPA